MSHGDIEWKTLSIVEISRTRLASASHGIAKLATGEPAVGFEETDTAGGAELEGNQG